MLWLFVLNGFPLLLYRLATIRSAPAALIGALFLREPFTRIRALSVLTMLTGLVMLRL